MPLLLLLIACTVCYAAFEIFAAKAGASVNSWLAAILYNGIGTVVPLIVFLSLTHKGKNSPRGMLFAGLAGIAIMLFSVFLARIFARGGHLDYVIPFIYGGAILLSSLFGVLVIKEKTSPLLSAGILLILVGVGLVVAAQSKLKV